MQIVWNRRQKKKRFKESKTKKGRAYSDKGEREGGQRKKKGREESETDVMNGNQISSF